MQLPMFCCVGPMPGPIAGAADLDCGSCFMNLLVHRRLPSMRLQLMSGQLNA